MGIFDTYGVYRCDCCGQRVPADEISVGEVNECNDCTDARIRTALRDARGYAHEHSVTVRAERLREAADLERKRRLEHE